MSEEQQPKSNHEEFYDKIGKQCEEYGINNALFLALSPDEDRNKELMIWYKGAQLDAARLSAMFAKMVKNKIMEDLQT